MLPISEDDRATLIKDHASKVSFRFSAEKIVEMRYLVAEKHHAIKLRLDIKKSEDLELLAFIKEMMMSQQRYMDGMITEVDVVMANIERASEKANAVLNREWDAVKAGEPEYRRALSNAKGIPQGAAGLLAVLFIVCTYIVLQDRFPANVASPHAQQDTTGQHATSGSSVPNAVKGGAPNAASALARGAR